MNDYDPKTPIARFVTQLAAAFGDGWTVDADASYMHGVFLNGPDVRLYLRDPNYYGQPGPLGKVEITGSVPASIPVHLRNSAGHGLEWGKISVSADRDIERIRGDIERRLLTTAREAHAAVLAREASDAANQAARHTLRDQLAVLLSHPRIGKDEADDNHTEILSYGGENGGDPCAEWRINHNGTRVRVTIDGLTPSQARQIAVLLYPKTA